MDANALIRAHGDYYPIDRIKPFLEWLPNAILYPGNRVRYRSNNRYIRIVWKPSPLNVCAPCRRLRYAFILAQSPAFLEF